MRIRTPVISFALLLVAMAAVAADPPAPGTAAAPQAPAPANSAPADKASAPAPSPTAAAPQATPPADAAAIAKSAHELGYAPRQRSGKLVYCKAEAEIGSHLSSMKCFTPEEMAAVVHRSIQNQDSVAKMQRTELYEESRH